MNNGTDVGHVANAYFRRRLQSAKPRKYDEQAKIHIFIGKVSSI